MEFTVKTVITENRFITTELFVDRVGFVRESIMRQILDAQEKQIEEALIGLGWTPPKKG